MDRRDNVSLITEDGLSGFEIAKKFALEVGSVFSVDGQGVPMQDQFYWHEVILIDDDAVYVAKREQIFTTQ